MKPLACRLPARLRLLAVLLAAVAAGSCCRQAAPRQETEPVGDSAPQVFVLVPGVAVELPLAPGETHVYRLRLAAGDFVQVRVDQQGIDLTVALDGPSGNRLLAADRPTGYSGPESLLAVAGAAGDHRLEISAGGGRAAGGYRLQVEKPRPAEADDRLRARAAALESRGDDARHRRAYDDALASYRQALRLWRQLEDPAGQGEILYRLGLTYRALDDLPKAAESYRQASELFQAAGDAGWQAIALINLGLALFNLGEPVPATRQYEQALPHARQAGYRWAEAMIRHNLGLAYKELGEVRSALLHYSAALELWDEDRDPDSKGTTLHDLGVLHGWLGESDRALDYLTAAQAVWVELGDRRLASTLNQLGKLHRQLGRLPEALGFHQRALELRRAAKHRRGEAAALSEIGRVHQQMDRPREALSSFQEARRILGELGRPRSEAKVLLYLAGLYADLGAWPRAADSYQDSLTLYGGLGHPTGEAESLVGLARAERAKGDFPAARAAMERALELLETVRSSSTRQGLRTSFFASIQPHFDFYIDLLMEQHRRQPDAGHDARAFAASERARSRSLLDLLAESGADLRRQTDQNLLTAERELQAEISTHVSLLETSDDAGVLASAQVERVEKRLRELMAELEEVRSEIRVRSPRYAALTQSRTLSLDEVRDLVLDSETALLEYRLGEERSFLWLVEQDSLKSFELPARAEIEHVARRAHDLLSRSHLPETRASVPNALCGLAEKVLEPVLGHLSRPRLAIVPDGGLEYVPFAALPAADDRRHCQTSPPLLAEHEIVTLPSASALAMLRREAGDQRPAPGLVAVIADPVFQAKDERLRHAGALDSTSAALPRLRFSRQEADAILALAGNAPHFLAVGFEATKEAVMTGRLSPYRIVHFATHGEIDARQPLRSRLVLSLLDEHGRSVDGSLRVHEVYGLDLSAELVVLSACQTALGAEVRGEGLVGMTRGFFYAGAASVLVTLWQVGDRGTAELMMRFYRGLLRQGLPAAAALRQAQLALWRDESRKAPFYWAGFVMHGEWSTLVSG